MEITRWELFHLDRETHVKIFLKKTHRSQSNRKIVLEVF